MHYRRVAIRTLFVLLGILFLVMAIINKQWEFVGKLLSSVVEYENGGLP